MRYVIKNPVKGYFTEMVMVRSEPILAPMDMALHAGSPSVKEGESIGTRVFYAPVFEAFLPKQAVQFDTQADAEAQIKNLLPDGKPNVQLGGPEVFVGCTVEESV